MQISGLLICDGLSGFGAVSPGVRILEDIFFKKLLLIIKTANFVYLCIHARRSFINRLKSCFSGRKQLLNLPISYTNDSVRFC